MSVHALASCLVQAKILPGTYVCSPQGLTLIHRTHRLITIDLVIDMHNAK